MSHNVKGILTVMVDETVTVSKIDTLIAKNGFDLDSIRGQTNGAYQFRQDNQDVHYSIPKKWLDSNKQQKKRRAEALLF